MDNIVIYVTYIHYHHGNHIYNNYIGVCGLITPWNHPMLIAVKKIAPAIATGNSIVVKPSELAPVSVLELGAVCSKAGLPDGVLNIVPGFGKEVGQLLCTHPAVRKVNHIYTVYR